VGTLPPFPPQLDLAVLNPIPNRYCSPLSPGPPPKIVPQFPNSSQHPRASSLRRTRNTHALPTSFHESPPSPSPRSRRPHRSQHPPHTASHNIPAPPPGLLRRCASPSPRSAAPVWTSTSAFPALPIPSSNAGGSDTATTFKSAYPSPHGTTPPAGASGSAISTGGPRCVCCLRGRRRCWLPGGSLFRAAVCLCEAAGPVQR
jgi:hypothetical protein